MTDPALTLAQYFNWLTENHRYYREPSPYTSEEAREAAKQIINQRKKEK